MFIFIKFGIRLTLSFFGALALLHVEFFEEKIDNLRNFSGKDIADNHRILVLFLLVIGILFLQNIVDEGFELIWPGFQI
jgi:hypothetical protein